MGCQSAFLCRQGRKRRRRLFPPFRHGPTRPRCALESALWWEGVVIDRAYRNWLDALPRSFAWWVCGLYWWVHRSRGTTLDRGDSIATDVAIVDVVNCGSTCTLVVHPCVFWLSRSYCRFLVGLHLLDKCVDDS